MFNNTTNMYSSAKRVTFFFVCDASGSVTCLCGMGNMTPLMLINGTIKEVLTTLGKNPQLRARAEVVFIAYSDTMKILVDKNAGEEGKAPEFVFDTFEGGDESNHYGYKSEYFIPLTDIVDNPPTIEPMGGGTHTARAIEAACHLRLERSKDILSTSACDVSPSEMFLFTDGHRGWQESTNYIDSVIKKSNELAYSKDSESKTIPVVIGLGNNLDDTTKKTLSRISEPIVGEKAFFWIKGASNGEVEKGVKELYKFIGPSLVATSNYVEGSIDTLLEGLRQQVRQVCPDLLCTVN